MCPFHGRHPHVKISDRWQIRVIACCDEFHELMEKIILVSQNKTQQNSNKVILITITVQEPHTATI